MKSFKEHLLEAPFTFRGNAKVHFVTQESKNGKFATVACGMKAGTKVFTGTQEGSEVTCGKCMSFMKREGLIEDEVKSTADKQRENYLNKFIEQLSDGCKKDEDESIDEEIPANSVGAGSVDFTPTKRNKRKDLN